MKNNPYVYIPAHKLAEIIEESCPPIGYTRDNECLRADEDCLKCWQSWLKDGE